MNWEFFIDNLTAGQIVPILGNDLSLIKDANDNPITLQQYIAQELCRRLEIDYTGQSIGNLALEFPNENIMLSTKSIYGKIDEDRLYLDPLIKLAEITDFKFFISTTLDNLLEKALRQARHLKRKDMRVLDYSLQQLSEPPDEEEDEENMPPTIFNLLGGFTNVTESAFNEEEMLEHFFSLASRQNRHPLASFIMEQVKNKILLFVGCDFPDWFMRFIIRILTNQRYKFRTFSDYFVYDMAHKSPELDNFLTRFNKKIVAIEGKEGRAAQAFVDELNDKWSEFQENRPIQYEGSVFLSYNHPDQEKVKVLKKLLRAKGIRNAWFDIDNLGAGEHQELIEKEIKSCEVFIPLISDNCLKNNESYTWKVEWAGIEGRMMADKYYGKPSFTLIPIVLDGTARNDERIPKFMRDVSIWDLDINQDRIIEEITKVLTPL